MLLSTHLSSSSILFCRSCLAMSQSPLAICVWFAVYMLLNMANAFELPQPQPPKYEVVTQTKSIGLGPVHRRHATTTGAAGTTITIAPDNTCGYISGSSGYYNAVACQSSVSCMWENDKIGFAFCGYDGIYSRCVPYADFVDPKKCDDNCLNNAMDLKW